MLRARDLAFVQGLGPTRRTLVAWNHRPWPVLRTWLAGSAFVAVVLLSAVWVVAHLTTPDPTPMALPGLNRPSTLSAVGFVLYRNSLVLALHAMACVAGYIAGCAIPRENVHRYGIWLKIHDHAGRLAILFVIGATTFSLLTQAYVLGSGASQLSHQLHIGPALLLLCLLPHALPELMALFLPLAAWILASRRGDWDQLLAATIITVGIAIPVLVVSGFVEVYVSPHLLRAVAG
jgi:Stage II sporulation protein M